MKRYGCAAVTAALGVALAGCSAGAVQGASPVGETRHANPPVVGAVNATPGPHVAVHELEFLHTDGAPKKDLDVPAIPERRLTTTKAPFTTKADDSTTDLDAETVSASGHLSEQSVDATIDAARESFAQCTHAYATFATRILIAPSGAVAEASISRSTPDDAKMRDCVTSTLKKLTFDRPGDTSVPLAFELEVQGESAGG